jgi:hypothetical protein
MKTKLLIAFAAGLFAIGCVFSAALAQKTPPGNSDKATGNQNATKGNSTGNSAKNQNNVSADDEIQGTGAAEPDVSDSQGKNKNKENRGQANAESHRSVVANFVHSLLAVADREGGIGQQVRVIAQQQNDNKNKTSEEITTIENRSKIKTFFFGSDYKNLGDLRSQMVQTRNQIAQLTRLVDKADNDQDKTELQSQIQNLNQEQVNIDNFITQNENRFSLFGWAVKLFQ